VSSIFDEVTGKLGCSVLQKLGIRRQIQLESRIGIINLCRGVKSVKRYKTYWLRKQDSLNMPGVQSFMKMLTPVERRSNTANGSALMGEKGAPKPSRTEDEKTQTFEKAIWH
jgi:hypothetical protein